MRIQKRTKQPKFKLNATVLAKIRLRIENAAKRFNVSKSFVIAVILADYFDIKEQEQI